MNNKVRGRVLEVGSYAVAGAIALGALGHCLFGSCLTGSGAAQAAAGARPPAERVVAGGRAKPNAPAQAVAPEEATSTGAARSAKVVSRQFAISGMFCTGCVEHISSAVRKVPGVKAITIDYESGKGTITYVDGKVDPATLVAAIKKAGYKAKPTS